MRKLTIIFIVAVLAFPLVNASVLEKPDWKEGDYWEYIGNATYHCIVAKQKDNASEKLVYHDEENLAIVKEMIYDNETNKTQEKIYDPPFSLIQYPIFIGKKWNTTVEWKNTSTTIQLECTGKKDMLTEAGKFDCYVIKANYTPNGTVNPHFYQVIYISGVVGNIVRSESYVNDTLMGYTVSLWCIFQRTTGLYNGDTFYCRWHIHFAACSA